MPVVEQASQRLGFSSGSTQGCSASPVLFFLALSSRKRDLTLVLDEPPTTMPSPVHTAAAAAAGIQAFYILFSAQIDSPVRVERGKLVRGAGVGAGCLRALWCSFESSGVLVCLSAAAKPADSALRRSFATVPVASVQRAGVVARAHAHTHTRTRAHRRARACPQEGDLEARS